MLFQKNHSYNLKETENKKQKIENRKQEIGKEEWRRCCASSSSSSSGRVVVEQRGPAAFLNVQIEGRAVLGKWVMRFIWVMILGLGLSAFSALAVTGPQVKATIKAQIDPTAIVGVRFLREDPSSCEFVTGFRGEGKVNGPDGIHARALREVKDWAANTFVIDAITPSGNLGTDAILIGHILRCK